MTHPDILKMEKYGELYPTAEPVYEYECEFCGDILQTGDTAYVCDELDEDKVFCCKDCFERYLGDLQTEKIRL